MQMTDKEWKDEEKKREKARKEKREKYMLALGIRAIMVIDPMNKLPNPTEEEATAKWNTISHRKRQDYLFLHETFAPVAQ